MSLASDANLEDGQDWPFAASLVREHFSYDAETGIVTWVRPTNRRIVAGSEAGYLDGHGYLAVGLYRRKIGLHRLAWAYVHGSWPKGEIDHINGCRTDNRIENLRDVTTQENAWNRVAVRTATGYLGVTQDHRDGSFVAQIRVGNNYRYLGRFSTPELAHAAYLGAKRVVHIIEQP